MNTSRIEIIDKWVEEIHAGQFRDGPEKLPYVTHLRAVKDIALDMIKDRWWSHDEEDMVAATALLHDSYEDGKATLDQIYNKLIEAGFHVARAASITKFTKILARPDKAAMSILAYLDEIHLYEVSRVVKIADMTHNSQTTKPGNRKDKYDLAIAYLKR